MATPSSSRDCSPKQRSNIDIPRASRSPTAGIGGGNGLSEAIPCSPPLSISSGSPTTLSINNSSNVSRGSPTLPPFGSGPSRQRSLRDRLKDGITGSFSWQ